MRAREFPIETTHTLTMQEVAAYFNNLQVTSDLKEVAGWFPRLTISFEIKHAVPVETFADTAKEMLSTYDEFPQDAARTKKIRKLIVCGEKQLPIFVEENNNFVLEGRHRIVAFYELSIPTVDVIYVYESENINEISHADVLGALSTPEESIIPKATIIGKIDSLDVYLYQQENSSLYFIKSNNKFAALVLLEGNHIKALKNFVKQPGYVTAIIGFIVHKLHIKLQVDSNEPLTSDGIRWLRLLLLRNGKGFTITDQDGNFPDVNKLEKEWHQSKESDVPGPTTIHISENINTIMRITDQAGRLMSTPIWIGDEKIL